MSGHIFVLDVKQQIKQTYAYNGTCRPILGWLPNRIDITLAMTREHLLSRIKTTQCSIRLAQIQRLLRLAKILTFGKYHIVQRAKNEGADKTERICRCRPLSVCNDLRFSRVETHLPPCMHCTYNTHSFDR